MVKKSQDSHPAKKSSVESSDPEGAVVYGPELMKYYRMKRCDESERGHEFPFDKNYGVCVHCKTKIGADNPLEG